MLYNVIRKTEKFIYRKMYSQYNSTFKVVIKGGVRCEFDALQDKEAALSLVRGRYSSFSLMLGTSLSPSEASTRFSPEYQLIRGGGRPANIKIT